MPAGYVTDSEDEDDQLEGLSDGEDENGIPGAVQSANCRVWSTKELYERMNKGLIDVEPPYQRDVVWNKNSQSALIDSILKNKWVPTLLFSERPACIEPDGTRIKPRWVCMDGKQRLTSIKLFLDGVIPWYRKPKEPMYFKQSNPPQPSRKLLSEALQEAFLTRGLTAAMYNQLTELQERDIFRLVQEGKPLTTGEKMHASAGPWGEYIAELTDQYMVNNLDRPNGWVRRISTLKRGADYKTMSQMVLLIRDMPLQAPNPPRYFSTIAIQNELDKLSKNAVPQKLKDEVRRLLDLFMEITTLAPPKTQYTIELNTPDAFYKPVQRGRKTLMAPVEVIWIPYLLYLYGSKLSKGKILEMIEYFKIDMRLRWHKEVKNNGDVTRWTIEWIKSFDLSRLQGTYAGWAVPRPAPQLMIQDAPKPDVSGMQEFARRSLSVQTSAKRDAPSPATTLASSPTAVATPLLKRPRRSMTTKGSSPTLPQPNSLPKVSSSLSRPAINQSTNTTTSANSEDPVMAAALRAKAVANGIQLPPNLLNNGHQPNSWTFPIKPISTASDYVNSHSASAQQAAAAWLVPNYASASARPAFQLPVKPAIPNHPQSVPQQTSSHSAARFSSTTTTTSSLFNCSPPPQPK